MKDLGLDEPAPAEIYLPHAQMGVGQMTLVVRSDVPPATLTAPVERAIRALDPNLPISALRSLDEVVARSVSQPRFYMLLLGTFALAALLLAAIGIFGVMSYAVTQQTREFGIRIALGADRRSIVRMVLVRAALAHHAGAGLGVAGALVVGRAMSTLLFDVNPRDPLTLATRGRRPGRGRLVRQLPARPPRDASRPDGGAPRGLQPTATIPTPLRPYAPLKCGFSMIPITLPKGSFNVATLMSPPTSAIGSAGKAPGPPAPRAPPDVGHAPIGDGVVAELHAGHVRVQPQLESSDVESHVKRLVEVRRDAKGRRIPRLCARRRRARGR